MASSVFGKTFFLWAALLVLCAFFSSCQAQKLSDDDLDTFLESYYGALTEGSTKAIEEYFMNNSTMALIMFEEGEERTVIPGLAAILESLQSWYDMRGTVQGDISYEVLKYQFPLLIVQGKMETDLFGGGHFLQIFALSEVEGQLKVCFSGVNAKQGVNPDEEIPKELLASIEDVIKGIDNQDTTALESLFLPESLVMVNQNFANGTMKKDVFEGLDFFIAAMKECFKNRGNAETKEFEVVVYMYPIVIISGVTTTEKGNSEFLQGMLLQKHVEGEEYKVERSAIAVTYETYNGPAVAA